MRQQEVNRKTWKNDFCSFGEPINCNCMARAERSAAQRWLLCSVKDSLWMRFILSYLLYLSSIAHLSPECWQPAEVEAPCSEEKEHLCQWYSATHQPVSSYS